MIPSRRKILLLIPSLVGGGAERVFSILLTHLDRVRFELHLAVLQEYRPYMSDVPPDVTVHPLRASRVRYALPRIVRLVRNLKPHVILSTLGHLNVMVVMSKPLMPLGTKVLIREASLASTLVRDATGYSPLQQWFYRCFYKRADKVVCPSDATLNDLAKNFAVPQEKLVRIYNPLDIEKLRKLAQEDANSRLGPGPNLIAVGRLSREKGPDILLEAMPAILECLPDAQLRILGDGPLLTDLVEQAKRLGLSKHVHFLGFKTNPWSYMRCADVLVLPSRVEGLPNAALEALALGLRVVATDCGGTREIQAFNPSMALVPVENPKALAKAIVDACRAQIRSDGMQAQRNLRAFDLKEVLEDYSRLFETA